MAERIKDDDDDLPLTKKEVALIREAYVDANVHGWSCGVHVCTTTLTATDGVTLDFEVCIDDGGEPFDAKSPYDLKDGGGFDPDGMIQVD